MYCACTVAIAVDHYSRTPDGSPSSKEYSPLLRRCFSNPSLQIPMHMSTSLKIISFKTVLLDLEDGLSSGASLPVYHTYSFML